MTTQSNFADQNEIRNVVGAYTFGWDEGRPEEFRGMFTEDAIFETWKPGKESLFYKFGNLQEIIDGRNGLGSGLVIRHNLSEVVFLELDEKTAKTKTVYTFSMFFKAAQDQPSVIVSGSFNDAWVKTNVGWRIKERVIIYDNLPPTLVEMMSSR